MSLYLYENIVNEFAIIIVYVDDINIVITPNKLTNAIDCLKKESKMKDLGREIFYLRLGIEYLNKAIFVHEETYIMKVLKRF